MKGRYVLAVGIGALGLTYSWLKVHLGEVQFVIGALIYLFALATIAKLIDR